MTDIDRYRIDTSAVSYERFDDELIIISFDNGNYYSLDLVAADIWELLREPHTGEELASAIARLYPESAGEIGPAVRQFLIELEAEGLIVSARDGDGVRTGEAAAPLHTGDSRRAAAFRRPVLQRYGDMQDLLLLDPIHEVSEEGWPHREERDVPA